jgi:hypothetical protein
VASPLAGTGTGEASLAAWQMLADENEEVVGFL